MSRRCNPRREMLKGIEAVAVGLFLTFGAWVSRPLSFRSDLDASNVEAQQLYSRPVFYICASLSIGAVLFGLWRLRRATAHRRGT